MLSNDEIVRNVSLELELTEDERLIRLGKHIALQGIGSDAGDFDDDHYKHLGGGLLSRIMGRAQQRICESDEIRITVTKLGGQDKLALAPPIADIIATFVSGPAIFTCTASIIVLGLNSYCARYWNKT
jgi:hypothetical protein